MNNTVQLDEAMDFIRGITFKPEQLIDVGSEDAVVCMRTKNVQRDLDESDLIAVPKSIMRDDKKYLKPGDVLVSSANSWELVGKCSYVGDLDYLATAGGFISIIRPKKGKTHPRFLYHWLTNPATQHAIRHLGRQTTNISNLDVKRFKKLAIPAFEFREQKAITDLLDNADSIRRRQEKALAMVDDLLQSIFLEMFGDPELNPKGWPRKPFSEIAKIDTKMVDPRKDEYIDRLHIGPDVIQGVTGKILPARTAREDGLKSGKYLFDESHILFSKIRPYLRKAALPDFSGLCSADMYPIRAISGVSTKEFLWAILISPAYVAYFNRLPSRANIPKINMKEMNAYQCICPPYDLQEAFSEKFAMVLALKAYNEKACSVAVEAFEALSQRAFRGEL